MINAPVGQVFTHLPQLVHFDSSTTGASKPICVKAPNEQTRTAGHRWFWGQNLFLTVIDIGFSFSTIDHLRVKAPEKMAPMTAP
jgi:hypothetical protein